MNGFLAEILQKNFMNTNILVYKVYKEFITFGRKFDRSTVFFIHCLKLGNMHVETPSVIELYNIRSMTDDSRV